MEQLLLRPSDVCEVIGLGKSKVYALIAEGVIPSVRIGKSVRIPVDALRLWVESVAKMSPAKPQDLEREPPKNTSARIGD